MKILTKGMLKRTSVLTLLLFVFSTFGSAYAQMPTVNIPVNQTQPVDISILNNVIPELNQLQSNLRTAQSTLTSIEAIATPLYNQVAPSNMESMGIAERIKAILNNSKVLLATTPSTKAALEAGTSPMDLSLDQQMAYGLEQLSVQTAKLQANPNAAGAIEKLKSVLAVVTEKLQSIITVIRAKIFAVGQRVGLIGKDKQFVDGKVKDAKGAIKASQQVQYADSFGGKLSKGVADGVQSAKTSLKSSFSLTNLALTTTVAVGTNMAIDMIHGNKPSFSQAVKSVATLEFAGNVAGAALGAAGGQFTSTLVRTFVPGPVGALVGAVIPVMFASGGGQMGANLISGLKNGNFSISQAWNKIDKVDLAGSSIGSTIGMALGAPIPIIGPIVGGILGGMLGSKVAKLIQGFTRGGKVSLFKRGSEVNQPQGQNFMSAPVSVGTIAGPQSSGPVVMGSQSGDSVAVSSVSASALQAAEERYYDAYLQYNRLVESGKHDEAQAVFVELKKFSDEYSALRRQMKAD